jgi:hypothetical protein
MARDAQFDLLEPVACGRGRGSSATSSRPPAMASACIASVTRCANSLAAKLRFFDS